MMSNRKGHASPNVYIYILFYVYVCARAYGHKLQDEHYHFNLVHKCESYSHFLTIGICIHVPPPPIEMLLRFITIEKKK
jgi:hypothetical protein